MKTSFSYWIKGFCFTVWTCKPKTCFYLNINDKEEGVADREDKLITLTRTYIRSMKVYEYALTVGRIQLSFARVF